MPEPRPILTAPFLLLMGAHFLQALGWSSMLLLPLYLDWLGGSRAEVGSVMAASAIGGLASRPLVGWALDKVGRKRTLVAGTFLLVGGVALLAMVQRIGPLVFAARIVMGIGIGALFTGYFTLAADVIPAERRTEGLALFGISGLVPLALNPLVGRLGIEPPQLRWFYLGVAAIILSSLILLAPLRDVPHSADRPAPTVRGREVLASLRRRPLWPVWLGSIVFSGLAAIFMAYVTVTAGNRGVEDPALMWLTYAGGAVLVRAAGAQLPDRVGPSRVLAGALGLYVTGMWLAAGAHTAAAFALTGLLAGLGHGYAFPVLAGQVVTRAPDNVRGAAMALYTALWDGSKLLLVPFFGLIADRAGDASMFRIAATCGAIGLATWALTERRVGLTRDPEGRASTAKQGASTPGTMQ